MTIHEIYILFLIIMATSALTGLLVKCPTSIQIGQTITATVAPTPVTANTIEWTALDSSGNTITSDLVLITPAEPPISATVKLLSILPRSQTSFRLKLEEGDYVSYITIHMAESVLSAKLTLDNGTNLVSKSKTAKCVFKVVSTLSENSTIFTGKFTSSNPGVASVDASGVVTGKSVGTTTLTVTLSDAPKSTATLAVTVIAGALTDIPIQSIAMTLPDVFVGKDSLISLTTSPLSAKYTNLVYSSSDESIVYISSTGLVRGISPGSVVITVRLKDAYGSGFIASLTKVVTVATDSITVSPSLVRNVNIGEVNTYDIGDIVTIAPATSTMSASDLVWASSKPAVATALVDGANLVVTALTNGTTVISAKSPTNPKLIASMTFIVETALGTLTTNVPATLFVDKTFAPKVTALNGTTGSAYSSLVWTSDAPLVVSVSPKGVLTGLSAGSCNITATITGPSGTTLSSSTAVTVVKAVQAIQVTPNTAKLDISSYATSTTPVTETLTATVFPLDAGNTNITWKSSAPLIASIPASSTGSTVVVTALKVGVTIITATSQDTGAVIFSVPVNVGKAITSAVITGIPVSMVSGASVPLKVTVTPADATIDSTIWSAGTAGYLTDAGVIVSPSESDMATNNGTFTISSNGQWSAVVSNSFTPSPVTATAANIVTVTSAVRSLEIDPIEPIAQGATYTIPVVIVPFYAVNQVLAWVSSDTSVATVNATTGVVTGVAAFGSAKITATTTDGSKISASTIITVGTPAANNYSVLVDFTGVGELPTEAPAQIIADIWNYTPNLTNLIIPSPSDNVIYKVDYSTTPGTITTVIGTYKSPTMVPISIGYWAEPYYYYYDNLDGSVHRISVDGSTGLNILPGSTTPAGMMNLPIIAEVSDVYLLVVRKGTNPDPIKYDPVSGQYVTNHLANYAIYRVDITSRVAYAQWLAQGAVGDMPGIVDDVLIAGNTASTSTVTQDSPGGYYNSLLKPFTFMAFDSSYLMFIDRSNPTPRLRKVHIYDGTTTSLDIKGDIPSSGFNSLSYSQAWTGMLLATGDSSVYAIYDPYVTSSDNYYTSVKVAGGSFDTLPGSSIYYANFVKPLSAIFSNDGAMYVLDGGANQIVKLDQFYTRGDLAPVVTLDATKTGNGQITVSWTPCPNACAYMIICINYATNGVVSCKMMDVKNIKYTITGLLAGTYIVNVYARYFDGGLLAGDLSVTLESGYPVPMVTTLDTNAVYGTVGGTVLDASGVMYATDYANHYVYKIVKAANGTYTRTNLAGTGQAKSRTSNIGFNQPLGIAYNPNTPLTPLYVCDSQNNRILSLTPTGTISTVFDGLSLFDTEPKSIVCDVANNVLYVSDGYVIYEIPLSDTGNSKIITGSLNYGLSPGISSIRGLTIDSVNALLYTIGTDSNDLQMRVVSIQLPLANMAPVDKVGTVKVYKVNSVAGYLSPGDGVKLSCVNLKTSSTTSMPALAVVMPGYSLASYFIKNVNIFDAVQISGIGYPVSDGPLSNFSFSTPIDITSDVSGNLYVCDSGTNSLRVIRSSATPSSLNKNYSYTVYNYPNFSTASLYYNGGYGGIVYMITTRINDSNAVIYKYIDAFTFLANYYDGSQSFINLDYGSNNLIYSFDITPINSLGIGNSPFSTQMQVSGAWWTASNIDSLSQIGASYNSVTVQFAHSGYSASYYLYTVSDTNNNIVITNDTFNNSYTVINPGNIIDHGLENKTVTFTGLKINTTYNISVTPVNGYGPSRSDQILTGDGQASTLVSPILGAPSIDSYNDVTDTNVTINVLYNGGSTVQLVNIYTIINGVTSLHLTDGFTGGLEARLVASLLSGTSYSVYVTVVNAHGYESAKSNEISFTTTGNPPPGAPTITAPAVEDVLGTLLRVLWTPPLDLVVDGYIVYYSLTGYDTVSNPSPLLTSTEHYIYNLPLSSNIYVSVVAVTAGTPSTPSELMYTTTNGTPYFTPDPVNPVAVVQVGTAVGVQWGQTTTPLTGFVLDYQLVGSTDPYTRVYLPPTQNLYLFNYPPEAPVNSLASGTYNIILRAKNDTIFSSAVSVGMVVQLSSAPDAPTFIEPSVADIGDNFINLSWIVPSQPTSSFPSNGYYISYGVGYQGTKDNFVHVVDGNASSFKLTGLLPSTKYYISINSSGVGGDSEFDNIEVTTIAPGVTMVASTVLSSDGHQLISVDWVASTSFSPGIVFALGTASGPGAPEGTSNEYEGTYVFKTYIQPGTTYTLYAIGGSPSLGTVQSSITYTA